MIDGPDHDHRDSTLVLRPSMQSATRPFWEGAQWIGDVWVDAVSPVLPARCRLEQAHGFRRARLLVRGGNRVFGFVEVDVTDGEIDPSELRRQVLGRVAAITGATPVAEVVERRQLPAVTVVICTRDRVELLTTALESVLAVDYPDFDVIIVDNASRTNHTRDYVLELAEPRVRLVEEPLPGVSRARNAGLLAASSAIVAFVDDDVVVDRHWLRALVNGFARGESVACVSGIVPAGEISTPAQAYFDRRVGWSASTEARVFDMAHPPDDVPLFPFAVRCYGTGANFAVKRDAVLPLGFDETLGAGVPTGGGEDLDVFLRILLAGNQLVHEPAAIVWHRHRADNDALLKQMSGYGLGLGAWLAKIVHHRSMAKLAFKTVALRAPAFIRHMRAASQEVVPSDNLADLLPSNIGDPMWKQMARGAALYRRAQRDANLPVPILGRTSRHPGAVGSARMDVV